MSARGSRHVHIGLTGSEDDHTQRTGGAMGWMLSGELQRRVGDGSGWREKLRDRLGEGKGG